MDSLITAAARALSAGDPIGALKRVALRDDAPALALRGIAMAQLGDLARAKQLLRSAARAFGAKEPLSRARCVLAEAEVALASRDLAWPTKSLDTARATLDAHGDQVNVAHAHLLAARRCLLVGRIDDAERALEPLNGMRTPPSLRTVHELVLASTAVRRLDTAAATAALSRARRTARQTGIPSLVAEVEDAFRVLETPAARRITHAEERPLVLAEVEGVLGSSAFIVDACRYVVRHAGSTVSLAGRPVLFAIARTLGEAWPADASRKALIAHAFGSTSSDDSHRARLRVEVARLRQMLRPLADVRATARGFALTPHHARDVIVLARPTDEEHPAVLALLSDGESWSSSALALALGTSQRSVQRALDALAAAGKVQALGRGRARRWTTPPAIGFTTTLLLPHHLPVG